MRDRPPLASAIRLHGSSAWLVALSLARLVLPASDHTDARRLATGHTIETVGHFLLGSTRRSPFFSLDALSLFLSHNTYPYTWLVAPHLAQPSSNQGATHNNLANQRA
mmetsp:Transcript_16424/g.52352  ORF Transcript_16424/g.52352 Transcript_16424/m.52352 type:complete len:108 (+) Transcript_16424:872-1195(+)